MKGRGVRTTTMGLLVFSFVLAACNYSMSSSGSGPRAWIDSPLDGSVLEPGVVLVRSHVADSAGVVEVALLVNGTQIRVDSPADAGAPITSIDQAWDASLPGEYTLELLPKNASGDVGRSAPVRVQVGILPSSPTPATPSPTSAATISATPTPTETATAQAQPMARLRVNAFCRSGPGTAYDIITSLAPGDELPIVGRNDAGTWWVVRDPSGSPTCWISVSTADPLGPVAGVPVAPTPLLPTVKPAPPETPGDLSITARTCVSGTYSVTLGWSDEAGNEAGYRVYRDGTLIATLGAGATSYTDNPPGSGPYVYGVEAYNDAGASGRPTVNEDGCVL